MTSTGELVVTEVGAAVPAPTSTVAMQHVVDSAVGQAEILRKAIVDQQLSSRIQGREYIQVEGWQFVLALNNIVPIISKSKRLKDDEGETVGWEATCELRDGVLVVGTGTGMCTRSEKTWSKRDEYALRSMAETRAIGKACRNRFGFLAKMAGFEATPNEEMSGALTMDQTVRRHAMDQAKSKAGAKRLYDEAAAHLELDTPITEESAGAAMIQAITDLTATFTEEGDGVDGEA